MRDKCVKMSENANKMRDRLIKLLKQAEKQQSLNAVCGDIDSLIDSPKGAEFIADYLLANGVILPPCKVGDMVYFVLEDLDEETDGKFISSQRINEVSTRGIFVSDSLSEENCRIFVPYSDFGENVFLSKAEAERALKKVKKNRNNCVDCDECLHRSEDCLCDISNNDDECPLLNLKGGE